MRPNVRWQRHVRYWLDGSWDAEITALKGAGNISEVVLKFSIDAEIPDERFEPGEIIELLDGPRVIGVGKFR